MSTTELEQEVIAKLNSEFGRDIKQLHKAKLFVKQKRQRLGEIHGKLNPDDTRAASLVKTAIGESRVKVKEIDFQIDRVRDFEKKTSVSLKNYKGIWSSVSDNLEHIETTQHLIEYLKILRDVHEIADELSFCIKGKDDQKTIGLYLSLSGEYQSSNSVLGRLQNVQAANLKSFATKTASYWHDLLLEKFSKDFEVVLKTIKWPYYGGSLLDPSTISKENLNKLTTTAEYLFLIRPPRLPNTAHVVLAPGITCPPISHPIQLLLKSFRQRFNYHFSGIKQTNRLDKPEWYLTQILTWAKDHHIFIGQHFQPAALRAGLAEHNVRLEFVRGLVQLSMEKLNEDIEEIFQDEHLFAHLLDEVLSFELELKEILSYPSTFPSAISILTQGQYLLKWLSIEEKFTSTKMDAILTESADPWESLDPCNFEEMKLPQCADQFLHLLDAIKERYRLLVQPGHQLQFLQLQLDLIENFRRRLVQLHNTGTVSTAKVLSAINYVTAVLREWGENVHYLHLHAALMGPDADEINSVFDNSVELLEQWQRKLIRELASRIVDEIKAKSMSYRHDNWVSMPEQNAKEPFILSPTAGEMFQVMVTSLHNLETELSLNLFSLTLRLIAQQLDEFFLDAMIINTKFSTGGASQFQFDMVRNLLPLFGQYIRRPDLMFKNVNDATTLLTLPIGTAMLLQESLKYDDSVKRTQHRNLLQEVKVINLQPRIALDIVERRTDVCF